jgi:hypothetical protein
MAHSLSQGQKALNQRLLAEHCMSEEALQQVYQEIMEQGMDMGNNSGRNLKECIQSCNAQLKYLGLEIVALKWPADHKRYFAIRNQHADSVAHHVWGTQFHASSSVPEFAFVSKVLHTLSEQGPTSRADLINLKNEIDNCKVALAEAMIQKLVDGKWIQAQQGSTMELAPRTYLELSQTLVEDWGMDPDTIPQTIVFHKR